MCSLIAYKWSRSGLVTLGLDRHRRIDVNRGRRRHRGIAARKFCLRQGRLVKRTLVLQTRVHTRSVLEQRVVVIVSLVRGVFAAEAPPNHLSSARPARIRLTC